MTVINFNDLSRGTVVDNEYSAEGVTVSAVGGSGQAMIFDTANPTGGDWDLQTSNLGKALIISEDGDSYDPDDNASGGILRFVFDEATSVESLTFLDNEEGAYVRFYDENGTLMSTQFINPNGDNLQSIESFNTDGVYRMDVELCGSGAIDNLVFTSGPAAALDGTVEGTSGDDTIDAGYDGDPDGDRIDANDQILPGAGIDDDLVYAYGGNDAVKAGAGHDVVYGGTGDDKIEGGTGDDVLHGDAGRDELKGEAGNDTLFGGEGDDKLFGGIGNDDLYGGAGNESYLKGGDGDDNIYGGAGNDKLDGEDGNDTLFGGDGIDELKGGKGDDVFYGGAGADKIDGSYDRDTIVGADAGDEINGGSGGDDYDTLDLSDSGPLNVIYTSSDNEDGYIEFLDVDGNVTGTATFQEIENIILPSDGTVTGTNGNDLIDVNYVGDPDGDMVDNNDAVLAGDVGNDDLIVAGDGDDTVIAGDGDDEILAGSGNDTVYGDDGNDVIYGDSGVIPTTPTSGGAGTDLCEMSGEHGKPVSLTFNFTGLSADRVLLNGGEDKHLVSDLYGTDGDDTSYFIVTDKDDNVLFEGNVTVGEEFTFTNGGGTFGSQTLINIYDQQGGTLLQELNVHTSCSVPITMGDQYGSIVLSGATLEDGTLVDAPLDPVIDGVAGDDMLFGGAGDDVIFGEDGNDEIFGGTGNDFLLGGNGADEIEGGEGDDTLCGNDGDDTLFGGNGNDILEGMNDNDVLFGGAGDDRIYSDAGDDVADGGAGDDSIYGGSGDDTLSGDAGNDNIYGGADRDVILGGAGDTVDGGSTGDDYDILDLTGQGTYILTGPDGTGSPIPDSNGNGFDGRVVFVDANGTPTGEIINYTEIEEVRGDEMNSDPVATNDAFDANEDDADAVLGNVITGDTGNGADSDPDGDTLTVSEVNGDPAGVGQPVAGSNGGLVTINPDGTVSFNPNGEFEALGEGEEETTTVTYTVTDPDGAESTATVTFTVTGTNDAPTAVLDTFTADEDDITDLGNVVSANDTDPEGDTLTVSEVGGDASGVGQPVAGSGGGLITINEDGSASFDPNGEFNDLADGEEATTEVTYTITDPDGATSSTTVTITVTGTNDGPTAVADGFDTDEDTAGDLGNVLGNDEDPDGDTLAVSEVNGDPANVGQPVPATGGGLVTINPDGSISFDPNGEFEELAPGESADVTVTYTATDPSGETSTTTVTITVDGVNDGPDATDNAYVVTLTEGAGDVDGNVITQDTGNGVDSDPENDNLTVVAVGGLAAGVGTAVAGDNGGLFTINADGSVDFDANGDFDDLGLNNSDQTSVTYTIVDENGAEDTATVTFTVTGINNGTVEGTLGNDIINPGYVDADGDIVDGNDAILPGDTGNDDLIYGYGGDDSINAGTGNDEVYGGTGDDSVSGGVGHDTVYGGEGNDTLNGNQGNDTVYGGAGNDVVNGGLGNDSINGGTGNDTLNGEDGNDNIEGGDGDDMINGGAGNDVLSGGIGNDKIEGSEGEDTMSGGAGDDDIWGGLDDDTLFGGSGNDTLGGGAGNDSITGGSGSDLVEGGDGDDVIDTSNGSQGALDYDYPSLPFGDNDVFPNNDLDTVFGGAGNDIIFTGDDADSIDGGDGDDFIDAGIDNDSVTGGAGNDTIIGGQGEDIIEGNDGDDLIYGGLEDQVLNLPDDIDEAPDDNRDTVYGGDGNDTIYGRDDDDTLYGDAGNDLIYGGVDDDSIYGGEGNDTLFGDEGDDRITGQVGIDTIYGGTGNDIVGGGYGDFGDEVYGDEGDDVVLGGNGGDTLFGGEGDDRIDGDGGADTIYGDDGNDSIQAGVGDDTLFGGDGNDIIRGNIGADIIEGGAGDDYIYSGAGAGQVLDATDPDPTNDMDTVYGGAGNDVILGGDDADELYGGEGNDTINGGIDNDTIHGGEGQDYLLGGQGSDTFFGGNGGDNVVGGEDADGSDFDVLDLTGSNVDFVTYTNGDPESGVVTFLDGSTMTFSEIENVIPCFTPGTTIATAKGERLVEELTVGDRIITRDNGIQEIAWVGHKEMTGKQLVQNPHLKPILIKAGALGNGLPERDMKVSPNHRVLVASELTQLYFEENEVLAAAKHMVGTNGIHAVDVMSTTYVHFMFERHEVVLSNGAWTESFQPGDYSLKGIGNSQRNEIMEIFPELATKTGLEGYQSARKALKKHEAKLLIK